MNYPLISEYVEAIKATEDNFEELTNLRPVLGDDRQPVMTSGNFAVVFKMQDVETGKFYALKCFTKEQEGRGEAYHLIAEELKDVDSSYLINIRYLDKELFVDTTQTDETEFPVLLMDWVEGKTLDKYLRENLDNKYALEMLAYRFSQLAQWLIPQPFAHGDLKPDNILVREDGTLALVDYDGMYVPAMKGQKARELGSPDFRHPLRTENDFNEFIDVFPIASILLSLNAISIKPLLLEEFGEPNRLLLSENDYRDISNSPIVHILLYLLSIKELAQIYSIFISSIMNPEVNCILELVVTDLQYEDTIYEMLSHTKTYENNTIKWIEDECGVEYSKDGKKLIKGCSLYEPYEIQTGTEIICDYAFFDEEWNELNQIVIPQSVKYIGRNPFAYCFTRIICRSPYFILKDNALYSVDKNRLIGFYGYKKENFEIPEGVKIIGDHAFAGRKIKNIKLSSTVEIIEDYAFLGCYSLESIELSKNLKTIGKGAFSNCENLQQLELPNGLLSIGSLAFSCTSIRTITLPSTLLSIGVNPFLYNRFLTIYCNAFLFEVEYNTLYTKGKKYIISCLSQELSFDIPQEATHIGQYAFYGCPFRKLFIHDNIKYIGKDAFDGCYYESLFDGYSMEIQVSKGRYSWARNLISNNTTIVKEIDTE